MPPFRFNIISRAEIQESVGGALMIAAIDDDGPHNMMITGPAGSGKTTVSLMRGERLVNEGKNILVVTYHDLLWRSLYNIASEELDPSVHKIKYWLRKNFAIEGEYTEEELKKALEDWEGVDEIIIDEGQDLPRKIFTALKEKSKKLTVGADNAQRVHEEGISSEQIRIELAMPGLEPLHIKLMYNYRNTYGIYNFARFFQPFNQIINNQLTIDRIPKGDGVKPTIFLVPDENTRIAQLKILLQNSGDRNVAVLVYHVEDVDFYANLIQDEFGIDCSRHHKNSHVQRDIENVLVTTFKSAKGLEFQVVILPNMETVGDKWYKTMEHYFVGSTRAKENLYLIARSDTVPMKMAHFENDTFILNKVKKLPRPPKEVRDDDAILPF
jgi:DNA helicase IV